jgi:hypothetical protein
LKCLSFGWTPYQSCLSSQHDKLHSVV